MTYESRLSNIIIRLKNYRNAHPEFTLQKIADHTGVSFSTVTRIFAEGSENQSFRYESIQPIAKMLLGLDDLDEGDEDEKALKAIISFKDTAYEDLKKQIGWLKEEYEKKLAHDREHYESRIEYLLQQSTLKDNIIKSLINDNDKSLLLKAFTEKDAEYTELNKHYRDLVSRLLDRKQGD
jgi:transcriptional regulator with XRE-family HTH domain